MWTGVSRTYRHGLPTCRTLEISDGGSRCHRQSKRGPNCLSACLVSSQPSAIFFLLYLLLEVAAYQQNVGRTGKPNFHGFTIFSIIFCKLGQIIQLKKIFKKIDICFGIWVVNCIKSGQLFHFSYKMNFFQKLNNFRYCQKM